MKLQRQLVIALLKGVTHLLCRIDAAQLQRIPAKGPLLMVVNHVNILEIPILFTQLQPRPVTGLVLARRWDNPWLRWLLAGLSTWMPAAIRPPGEFGNR